jgi:hypothetical protein
VFDLLLNGGILCFRLGELYLPNQEPEKFFNTLIYQVTWGLQTIHNVGMNVENNLLELIKTKFPRQSVRIEQLYKEDKDFRDLCSDYFSSLQALKKYRKISMEGKQSIDDYQTVLNDLEKELYDYIFP